MCLVIVHGPWPISFRSLSPCQIVSGCPALALTSLRQHEQQIAEPIEIDQRFPTTAAATSRIRPTSHRSARRHTARAKCNSAAAKVPPGRMKFRRGGSSASKWSMASSKARTSAASIRQPRIRFRPQPGHFGAKVEQLTLDPIEQAIDVVGQPGCPGQAQGRVQFIDGSADFGDRGVFGHAATARQAGFARVAGFGIDFMALPFFACAARAMVAWTDAKTSATIVE